MSGDLDLRQQSHETAFEEPAGAQAAHFSVVMYFAHCVFKHTLPVSGLASFLRYKSYLNHLPLASYEGHQ